ncbi:MAG: Cu(I)-responsive transcriptional regulator [Proteobacteria bacterium]|nr:Cu(I)-responsive transcriptional regulator [Pseudomonadota bacterium]
MMQSNGQLTIGQVAALSGVPPKTIRFYEESGIIASAYRNENRYRTYSETDVQTLRFIAHARGLGFSLKDVSELLSLYRDRKRASKDVRRLALAHLADLDRRIANLTAMRNTIADLAQRCRGDDRPECPIIEELEESDSSDRRKR